MGTRVPDAVAITIALPLAPGRARTPVVGYGVSILVHLAALGVLWIGSHREMIPPPREDTMELVLVAPERPPPLPPPPRVAVAPPPPVIEVPSPPPPVAVEPVAPVKPPPPKPVKQKKFEPPPVAPSPQAPIVEAPPPSPPVVKPAQVEAPPAPPPPPVQPPGLPSSYVNELAARINKLATGSYPRQALVRRMEGEVRYTITIDREGAMIAHRIEPSGFEMFDRAAEQTLLKAAPFAKPPDLGGMSYTMTGVIAYRLAE